MNFSFLMSAVVLLNIKLDHVVAGVILKFYCILVHPFSSLHNRLLMCHGKSHVSWDDGSVWLQDAAWTYEASMTTATPRGCREFHIPMAICFVRRSWTARWRHIEFKGRRESASPLKWQLLSVCLLTLKPPAINFHNPVEARTKAGYWSNGWWQFQPAVTFHIKERLLDYQGVHKHQNQTLGVTF